MCVFKKLVNLQANFYFFSCSFTLLSFVCLFVSVSFYVIIIIFCSTSSSKLIFNNKASGHSALFTLCGFSKYKLKKQNVDADAPPHDRVFIN